MDSYQTELSQQQIAFKALVAEIEKKGRQFSFYQLVFLLETQVVTLDRQVQTLDNHHGVPPELQEVGNLSLVDNKPVIDEYIRFRPHASFAFPKSDIESVEYLDSDKYKQKGLFLENLTDKSPYFVVEMNFLGLYGVSSSLPSFYTRAIINRENVNDELQTQEGSARRDFLDIFNHRIYSLLFQVWKRNRYYIHYAISESKKQASTDYQPAKDDIFSQQLFSLIGMGSAAIRKKSALQWHCLLPYAGLISMRVRSASIISQIMTHYFSLMLQNRIAVAIEECVLRTVNIDAQQYTILGKQHMQLQKNFVIGRRFNDYDSQFRVHIGPLRLREYQSFLPNGCQHKALIELIQFLLIEPLCFDIHLTLKESEVPQWQLKASDKQAYLGWSNFLAFKNKQGEIILPGVD